MAQFLTPSFLQASNASAVPYSGGKLYIYQTGTTTLLDLYSDEALTTPTANPIVADSAGVFGIAFLAETKFKAVLKDSGEVTIYTRDPVYSTGQADSVTASVVSFDGSAIGYSSDNVQDALEEVDGTYVKAINPSFTGGASVTNTLADASAGPILELHRDSASPAASDVMGAIDFYGEDSASNKELYASVRSVITDPTSTSEDAKVVVQTKVAGTLADRFHVGAGAWTEGATGGDPGAGKFNATEVQQAGAAIRPLIPGTPVSASGTSISFSSIPSWAREIVVSYAALSTDATASFMVRIGDSGGTASTGYVAATDIGGTTTTSTTGFIFTNSTGASSAASGAVRLTLLSAASFTWAMTGMAYDGDVNHSAGHKALSGVLDRVIVTTAAGTAAFDAGTVNVHYF